MSVEHLSDDEYATLKAQGVSGLDDDAYSRLKLPQGYGHPAFNAQWAAQHPILADVEQASQNVQNLQKSVGAVVGPVVKKLLGSTGEPGVDYQDDPAPEAAVLGGKVLRAGNEAVQRTGGYLADKAGKLLPPAAAVAVDGALTAPMSISEFLTPKDDASSGLMLLGSPQKLQETLGIGTKAEADTLEAMRSIPTTGDAQADMINQSLASQAGEAGATQAGRTRVVQPGPIDKLAGGAWSAASAIKPQYASAIIADPSILDTSVTPSVEAVSEEYSKVFKKLGMSIDSDNLRRVIGKGYFPNEGQVSQHLNNITNVLDGLETAENSTVPRLNASVNPDALFMARSEAAAVKRSGAYATNPSLRKYVDNAQNLLDDKLEESGMPEIKDLSAKFFRAKAQEEASAILPLNKNMSPNVLRTLLMGRNIGQGLGKLALGPDRLEGLGQLGAGLAMSPAVGAGAISTVAGTVPGTSGMTLPAVGASGLRRASLQSLMKKDEKEKGK